MLPLKLQFFAWCCLHLTKPTYSASILAVFPIEVKSHFYFHDAMMRSLADAGHQVTMITPYPSAPQHPNLTIINSRIERKKHTAQISKATRAGASWFSNLLNGLTKVFEPDCRHVMAMEEIQNLENFDIIFVELLPMYECYFPLSKRLNAPVVGTIPSRSLESSDRSVGNSRNPAIFPSEYTLLGAKMSFVERMINIYEEIQYQIYDFFVNKRIKIFYNELYPDQNPFSVSISLLFSNSHEIFLPRTTSSNAIDIGGMVVKSATLTPLDMNLKKFMNEARHGVILFTLGTLTRSDALPPGIITVLKETFAKIPQRVIWKHDDNIAGISDNVLLSKWIPQKEILAHKNLLAFISHCGVSSTYEGIYYGKPMILLPLFNDQPGNAGILKSLRVGIHLNLLNLNEVDLLNAINQLIANTTYRKNMEKLSRQFKDEPMSPSEKVVYWTEYILRHKKADYLRWVGADMPSYQYFLFEIIGFLIVMVTVAFFLTFHAGKYGSVLITKIRSNSWEKVKKLMLHSSELTQYDER